MTWRRPELPCLTLASLATLAACFIGAPWSHWLLAGAVALFPSALLALGARRAGSGGKLGRQAWPILALPLILAATLAGLLSVRGRADDGWWLGLPAGAALLIYGLFALPLVITTLGYAWTFDRWGLGRNDLDQLRRRFGAKQEREEP